MLVPDRGDPTMKIGLAGLRRIVLFRLCWPTLLVRLGFRGPSPHPKAAAFPPSQIRKGGLELLAIIMVEITIGH